MSEGANRPGLPDVRLHKFALHARVKMTDGMRFMLGGVAKRSSSAVNRWCRQCECRYSAINAALPPAAGRLHLEGSSGVSDRAVSAHNGGRKGAWPLGHMLRRTIAYSFGRAIYRTDSAR